MDDVSRTNGFNNESMVMIGVAFDFDDLYSGEKKLKKEVNDLKKEGKINVAVANQSIKEIDELEEKIANLQKELEKTNKTKVSRSTFQKYRQIYEGQFAEIEVRLEAIQKTIGEIIKTSPELGKNTSLDTMIQQCTEARDALMQTFDAAEKVAEIGKGGDVQISVSNDEINAINTAIKSLGNVYSDYKKALDEDEKDIYKRLKNGTPEELKNYYLEMNKEIGIHTQKVKALIKEYNDAPEDDFLIPLAKLQAEQLALQTVYKESKNVLEVAQQLNKETNGEFELLDSKIISKTIIGLDDVIKQSEKLKKEVPGTFHELVTLFNSVVKVKDVPISTEVEKTLDNLEKSATTAVKLSDLLNNGTIDIKLEGDFGQLRTKINEQLIEYQKELNLDPLIVPIKVSISSANVGEAIKDDAEKNLSVSEASIRNTKKEVKEAEKEASKTGQKVREIFIDLSKVTNKSTASILKVIENAVNKFVQDVKNALDSIFSETRNVHFELDKEDLANAKEMLKADSLVNKDDISSNLEHANEVAKLLVSNIKEILGLMEEENASSFGLTNYKTKGKDKNDKEFDAKSLIGQIKKYKEQAEEVKKVVQEEIFTKKPIYFELDIKPESLTKVREKVEGADLGRPLTQSLTKAESIAESVVDILSQLNGLDIKISNGKGKVAKDDINAIITGLMQILNSLKTINTTISNIKLAPVDSQLQVVETDFTQIIQKFDELMTKSSELVNELKESLKTIQVSIDNLGTTVDKALDEKTVHSVVEELNGIDLSRLETSLDNISNTLITASEIINKIATTVEEITSSSLDSQWKNIALKFKEIAKDSDNIDLRKSKKQVEEIIDMFATYQNAGGTSTLAMLTQNEKTLEKFQKLASSKYGSSFSVIDNAKMRETIDQTKELDTLLSSITTSLVSINGLQNVSKVFDALNIKDKTLEKILQLPDNLKIIAEKIRELDEKPYNGFIKQLTEITAQAEGLKALADVLEHSSKQIDAALELMKKEPNDVYKSLMSEVDVTKELNSLYKKYSKRGTFETKQPKEYAEVLELIKDNLQKIEEIRKSHINDEKTELATVGQIYDSEKVKKLNDEIREMFNWLDNIKDNNKTLLGQLNEELKVTKKFSSEFEKIAKGGGTKERSYSSDYVDILRQIQKILEDTKKYNNLEVTDENTISKVKSLNDQLETLFRTLQSISTYANDTDVAISQRMTNALTKAKKYERDYYSKWGYGKIPTDYNSEYSIILEQIKSKVEEIKRLGEIKVVTEDDVQRAEDLTLQVGKLFEKLVQVNKAAKGTQVTNLQNKIGQYVEKNTRLTAGMYNRLVDLFNQLNNGADLTEVELRDIATEFNQIKVAAKLAGKEGAGFLDAIKNKLKYGWAQSIAMFFSFYDIVRYFREISSVVIEINTNLIELAKVSDASIGQLYRDFSDFRDIAKETGGTINDIIQATANWARNGYNLADSKELARISSIFQNIGDGMSADQSNEYLVSILKGFDIEAKDAMVVLDTLNNVSNNAATSVQDLGEALERSSSAFGASNTNLSESVALLTKANEILQNPENVGTAFKSMSARLRAADTDIKNLEDGFTITTSKLRDLVKSLTGFDIQETEDSYKSIYQILLGIGKEWNNLTDIQQASLSEELFGKRNSQVGFAILNNVERLEEIYKLAENSAGSAMEEHQKYLEGVQYQIDVFSASVENLANTFMSSDFLKTAIKVGSEFIKILDSIISKLGALPTLIGVVSAALSTKWNIFSKFFDNFGLNQNEFQLSWTSNMSVVDIASMNNLRSAKLLIDEYNTSMMNTNRITKNTQLTHEAFISEVALGNPILAKYLQTLSKDSAATMREYQKALVAATVKTTALRVATAALQGVLFAAGSWIASKIIGLIDELVVTTDEAIEAGEKARQEIEKIDKTLKNQQKTVQDTAKRYAELAQGVDQISGKNHSLTNDDYQEFLDISNQLAEVFPQLVKGYDSNGNAILNLNGNVKTITNSLETLLASEREFANMQILEGMDKVYDSAYKSAKQYDRQIEVLEADLGSLNLAMQNFKTNLKNTHGQIKANGIEDLDTIQKKLKDIGIESSIVIPDFGESFIQIDEKYLSDKWFDKIAESLWNSGISSFEKQLNQISNQRKNEFNSKIQYGLSLLLQQAFDKFNINDVNLQGIYQSLFSDIDWYDLGIKDWIGVSNYIDDIFSKINNYPELLPTIQSVFDIQTKYDNNEVTVEEYQAKLKELVKLLRKIKVSDKDLVMRVEASLDYDFTEKDLINDTTKNRVNSEIEQLLSNYTFEGSDRKEAEDAIKEFINSLNKDDYEVLATLDLDKEESLKNIYKTRDEIFDEMNQNYQVGNVRLDERKIVSGIAMRKAGWNDVNPKDYATVYSMTDTIKDASGKEVDIVFTPILPDGTVLTPEQLSDYIKNNLNGAENILKADKKSNGGNNIVLRVSTDTSEEGRKELEEWTQSLHEIQADFYNDSYAADTFYDALEKLLKEKRIVDKFKIDYQKEDIEASIGGIQALQAAYQSLYEKKKSKKKGSDLAFLMTDLEDLKTKLVDANGEFKVSQETWNEFFDTCTDGEHTFDEMKNSLNLVLTEYVDGMIDLKNFNEKQAQAISTQLQLAGVTKKSADDYVKAKVEIAKSIQLVEDAGYDLEKQLDEEGLAFLEEANLSDYAREHLAFYYFQKQIGNGITIETAADCDNLMKLALMAGYTGDALERLNSLKLDLASVQTQIEDLYVGEGKDRHIKSGAYQAIEELKKAENNIQNQIKDIIEEDVYEKVRAKASEFSFDDKKLSSSGGGGKEEDKWKEAYEKELKELDHLHEMGLISDIHYYEEREKLNDKYFKDREKYTDEYNKNLEEIYKGFQSAYKQYVDDMSDYWQKSLEAGQISFQQYCKNMEKMLNDLHDAGKIDDETYFSKMADYYGSIIDNYDKAINAAQRLIKKQIDSLNKQKDSIEKSYKEQIELVQQEIDKLKEANDERQKELDLQKALYELNRAENQRTQYTYTSEQGFVYKANEQDMKNAQEEVEQTQYEMYISTLEKKIETLETEMENLISAIDDQIDKLQDYSDRLGDTANKWKEAHEDMVAASVWGSDWQNSILAMDEELLSNFTDNYVSMQQRQADMAVQAANVIVDAYNKQIEALNAWKEAQEKAEKTSGVSKLGNSALKDNSDNNSQRKDTTTKTSTSSSNRAVRYAYKDSSGKVKYVYGQGTKNATPGYHEIAEDGDEIVLDNYGNAFYAKGHQLHQFEGGEKVFNEKETKKLLNGKYLPIDEVLPNYADMLNKVVNNGIMKTTIPTISSTSKSLSSTSKPDISNTINITVGDIHVTEVDNATELAKAITNKLPNALFQELNRK